MKNPGYEVVWPRGNRTVGATPLARRLDTLKGKTIGFLWNYAFRGDQMFQVIEREFAKRYPNSKFVSYDEFGHIHGAGEAEVVAALPQKLKQNKCDAVICGVGC